MTQRWQGLREWTRNQRVSQRHEQTASEILSPHPYGHSAELTSSSDASESKFWLCPFGAGGRCHHTGHILEGVGHLSLLFTWSKWCETRACWRTRRTGIWAVPLLPTPKFRVHPTVLAPWQFRYGVSIYQQCPVCSHAHSLFSLHARTPVPTVWARKMSYDFWRSLLLVTCLQKTCLTSLSSVPSSAKLGYK